MAEAQVVEGAARQFTAQLLGGPCSEVESTPSIATSVTTLVEGNGDRVGVAFINLGVNNVNIGLDASVSSSKGILLAAGGGSASFDVRTDFTLPSRKWSAIANGGASTVYVLEIFRSKLTTQ